MSFIVKPVAADLPDLLRQLRPSCTYTLKARWSPRAIFLRWQRNSVSITCWKNRSAHAFTNLQSFLDIYYAGASVLITERDFADTARAHFVKAAAADHVLHTELFLTHSTARGKHGTVENNGLHRACVDADRL
jgi:adenosine deaminase